MTLYIHSELYVTALHCAGKAIRITITEYKTKFHFLRICQRIHLNAIMAALWHVSWNQIIQLSQGVCTEPK